MTKQPADKPTKETDDYKFLGLPMPKKFLGVKLPGRARQFPALVWGAYFIFAAVAAAWLIFFIIPKGYEFLT